LLCASLRCGKVLWQPERIRALSRGKHSFSTCCINNARVFYTLGSGILGGSQIIGGTATASKGGRIGEYKLGFFGPNAEEVAGSGYISNEGGKNTNFGFSGAR